MSRYAKIATRFRAEQVETGKFREDLLARFGLSRDQVSKRSLTTF